MTSQTRKVSDAPSLSQLSIKTRIETGWKPREDKRPLRLSQLSIKTRIETRCQLLAKRPDDMFESAIH